MNNNLVDLVISNKDLVREILSRVPAKRLAKFKCVCKHWLALISDPQFGYDHFVQNPHPLFSGIYFDYDHLFSTNFRSIPFDGHSSLPPLNFLDGIVNYSTVKVIHAYNGLLLCSHRPGKLLSVSNPVTQKYTILPELNDNDTSWWNFMDCFGFDQLQSPHYKVIRIRPHKIHIFSSKEASWKSIPLTDRLDQPVTKVVFMDGVLHWLVTDNLHYELELSTEKLNIYVLPRKPIIFGKNVRYFGVCGVHLFLILGRGGSCIYRIFDLARDTYLWISKFRVDLRQLPIGQSQRLHVLTVVKKYKGDLALVLATPCGFISYNLKRTTHEVLCDFPPAQFSVISGHLGSYYANQFFESFFPI